MVASGIPEPSHIAGGELAALTTRLDRMSRDHAELSSQPKFPFSASHAGARDFAIVPSPTGDGTADIMIGNGAGGQLIQVKTDPLYRTKILRLLDQQGATMLSTDALAGYGVGVPSYAFPYSGYESLNLSGATSQATATEIGRGSAYMYNPATFVQPRIRVVSSTAETVNFFVQWKDVQGNLTNTTNKTFALAAGVPQVLTSSLGGFGKLWQADDMNGLCFAFFKAWCSSANPANISATLSYSEGRGISQAYYIDNAGAWAV